MAINKAKEITKGHFTNFAISTFCQAIYEGV